MEGGRYPKNRIGENPLALEEMTSLVSKRSGVSKKNTKKVLKAHIEEIKKGLLQNRKIIIRNFGSFDVMYRKERLWLSRPIKGDMTKKLVPAHRYPHYIPSYQFRKDMQALPEKFKFAGERWKERRESDFIEK